MLSRILPGRVDWEQRFEQREAIAMPGAASSSEGLLQEAVEQLPIAPGQVRLDDRDELASCGRSQATRGSVG